jgi:hypothetical protein
VGIDNVVEEEEFNQFDKITSFDTSYNEEKASLISTESFL